MRKTEKRNVVCLSDKGGLEMKQKDVDRREAGANGAEIDAETMEKWEEERARIEDEALKITKEDI